MWHSNLPMNSTEGHLDTVQQLRCLRQPGSRSQQGFLPKCGNPIELQHGNIWIDFITHRSSKHKSSKYANLLSNETSGQGDSTYCTNATAFEVQSHHKSQRLTFWALQGGAIRIYGRYVDIARSRWVYFHPVQ